MGKEARKLTFFERAWLRTLMPDLKKYKRQYSKGLNDEDNYVILNRNEFELMKKMVDRQDNYINQIKMNIEELNKLKQTNDEMNELIKETLSHLNSKEKARRKIAGRVGGLTAKLNSEKKENKMLLDRVFELESANKLQKIELEKAKIQNKILKDTGKKKQMDDFKKLSELNEDIKKHKRGR